MKAVSKKLRQQFAVVRDLLAVLGYDTAFCLAKFDEELQEPGTSATDITQLNFWLKASVRTFFAQVEGLTYAMRRFAVGAAEEGHVQLDKKIIAQPQERKYNKSTGELGPAFRGRFDDNFKNAFRYFPRVFGCDWTPEFQGAGWEKFRKLLDARDDFTHPKNPAHLFQGIPGQNVHSAVAWFGNTFNQLLTVVGRRLGKEIDLKNFIVPESLCKSKLDLIKPPDTTEDLGILLREVQFMALLREDDNAAYRVFIDGASLRNGGLSIGEMSQPGARLYVRTLFTEIEAIGYMTQRLLENSVSKGEISFSEEEHGLFSTKELALKIAHLAEIFSRKFGHDRSVDKSGKSWLAFSQVAAFRDRITHPKDSTDLQFSIDTLDSIAEALEWYRQLLDAIELSEKYMTLPFKA